MCAYALKKSVQNVLLLEASARPGGVIQSIKENGYLFEQGPQSFSSTAELAELCDDLQLTPEVVAAPHGAPRYVLIDGKLMKVPMSPALFVSGLLSLSTKFSLLRDALGKTSPPETDESIAAFVRRKFSAELLDRLVGPFVSGVYAGDPEQLSLRAAFPKLYEAEKAAGSVVRGVFKLGKAARQKGATRPRPRPGLLSFRAGNEALVRALAAKLGASLRCNVTVAELKRTTESFHLRIRTVEGDEKLSCARLVLAVPTATAAELLSNVTPPACGALQKVSYAPVAVVSLGYRTEQIRHSMEGFGFLVPRSAGIRTLGAVWNSSLFPGRAPQGHVLLTSFMGGATDPAAASLPAEELATTVHRELSPLLRISGESVASRVTRYERAIPQYNLGHLDRLKSIQDAIGAVPGLWMTGNYWKGPAIGACVEHALSVAEAVRIG